MKQFEKYCPEAWQEGVLVVPPVVEHRQFAVKRNQHWTVRMAATAISFGVAALFSFPLPTAAETAPSALRYTPAHHSVGSTAGDVPPGYWPKALEAYKRAPVLPDDSHIPDPEPLF